MNGRIVLVTIGALVAVPVVALLTLLGAPLEFSISWVLLVVAIGIVTRQTFVDDSLVWPPAERPRAVVGSEVSRLAWAVNARTGVVGHLIVRRVRETVRRRLAHHGLDLEDPAARTAIDALLGPGIRPMLTAREMRRSDLERVLDAVERMPEPAGPSRTG